MINPQWLELPMSRTNFHGPKDVRAIEVRLYFYSLLDAIDMRPPTFHEQIEININYLNYNNSKFIKVCLSSHYYETK